MKKLIHFINTSLKKRKVKVFLFFLLAATFAWLINNLSGTYTSSTFFEISYVNFPKDALLANRPKDKIQVRLKAVGFQFLAYGINPKKIKLDVSKVLEKDNKYLLTSDQIRIQLESQLASTSNLVDFDNDPIYFEFTSLEIKKVKIQPRLTLTFENNFILEGTPNVKPDSITITGPKNKIDSITVIQTEPISLSNLISDFSVTAPLQLPAFDSTVKVSNQNVTVSGTVVKFSEKIIQVPVHVINLPEGMQIRTFPEVVSLRCQGTLESLKALSVTDFSVEADYLNGNEKMGNRLPLNLEKYPSRLNNVSMDTNEIEFILRRE